MELLLEIIDAVFREMTLTDNLLLQARDSFQRTINLRWWSRKLLNLEMYFFIVTFMDTQGRRTCLCMDAIIQWRIGNSKRGYFHTCLARTVIILVMIIALLQFRRQKKLRREWLCIGKINLLILLHVNAHFVDQIVDCIRIVILLYLCI